MDTPFNQNNQTSTGFAFPVTETVAEPIGVTQTLNPVSSPILVPGPVAVNVTVGQMPVSQPAASPVAPPPPPFQPAASVVIEPVAPPNGMFVTEQKPKSKTKDILLVGLLLVLLAGAVFGFTKVRSLLSSAAEDGCAPIEIMEQDLTSNSMVVNFKTTDACKMQVAYGVDEILGLQMSEQIMATDHRIKLSPLMPSTPYKYQVRHDETKYEPTRGFLTLPATVAPTKAPVAPTVVVPTRNLTPTVTVAPIVTQALGTPAVKYTISDFELHFGSVDPRFDTDKNGIVNIRDWQLYSK